jgi:hypothetical protein
MGFELTDYEKLMIKTNSIERVINTSMGLVLKVRHEDAEMNHSDWVELKQLVVKLWNRERDTIFREQINSIEGTPK